MISDHIKFNQLMNEANQPFADIAVSLNEKGYSARDIAVLFLQTAFMIVHAHYGLKEVRPLCDEEVEEFEKCRKQLN